MICMLRLEFQEFYKFSGKQKEILREISGTSRTGIWTLFIRVAQPFGPVLDFPEPLAGQIFFIIIFDDKKENKISIKTNIERSVNAAFV